MNMIRTEWKRLLTRKSFLSIFLLFILLSIFAPAQFKDQFKLSYHVELCIIDQDRSEASKEFIEKLSSGTSISLVELPEAAPQGSEQGAEKAIEEASRKAIKEGKINACIVIPKDFFKQLPNAKMELIYSDLDVLAPALIDILSQNFIQEVCKETVLRRIEVQYGAYEAKKAGEEFDKLRNSDHFELEVIKEPYEALSGLHSKITIDDINGFRSILMYLICFHLIFVGLSLQTFRGASCNLIARMQVAGQANRRYFLASGVLLHSLMILIPLILSISSLLLLKMKFASFLYLFLASGIISLFFFELAGFLNTLIREENIAFTLNILIVIILSLVGGAFFSLDIMPEAFIKMASVSPFYVLSSAFYESMEGTFSSITSLALYLILFLVLYGMNLKFYSVRR